MELYKGPLPKDTAHAQPLWQVTSIDGDTTMQATLGITPLGFRLDVALTSALLPNQQYTLLANLTHPVAGFVTFLPSQLAEGVVVFDNDKIRSADQYNRLSNQDFGC